MHSQSQCPDIVVLGASAGGVSALQFIVRELPRDFHAAVFVVLHLHAESKSMLGPLLARSGSLPVYTAEDCEPIQRGRVYVAPPDHHLTVENDLVRVTLGPTQNRHRPSIDVLFRSAAVHYGPRVIGVVLTGFLNDGTAGLQTIKDCGGISVVQDPASAAVPSMPESALRDAAVDHCVPLAEIPALLTRLISLEHPKGTMDPKRLSQHRFEAEADLGRVREQDLEKHSKPSSYLCPDCGGGLWEVSGSPTRFRCRVGHGYSLEDLASSQDGLVENALWAAARSLEDRAVLSRRLADEWRERNAADVVAHFERQAERSAQHAATLRSLLGVPKPSDAA